MRKIDLTKQNIRCSGEPMFNDYADIIGFKWECLFDADNYFGIDTSRGDKFTGFYTKYLRGKDRIIAFYSKDTAGSTDMWELTRDEELFLRKLMEEYIGCDLKTYYDREVK